MDGNYLLIHTFALPNTMMLKATERSHYTSVLISTKSVSRVNRNAPDKR